MWYLTAAEGAVIGIIAEFDATVGAVFHTCLMI